MQRLEHPIKTIRQRHSWRTYNDRPIDGETLARLRAFCEAPGNPPFGGQCRFAVLDATDDQKARLSGTYGVIRGARHVLAGAVVREAKDLEDFAYLFEKIILFATSLDLGTCWLGGTLKRKGFADRLSLGQDEILPAISPVGYRASRRGLVDRVFRMGAGSKNRKPFEELFFDGDFGRPLTKSLAGKYAQCLESVRIGPSASNKQPWRLVRQDEIFHLYLSRSAGYINRMGPVDLQRLDMGIAMCHFELAAGETGLDGHWKVLVPAPEAGALPEDTHYVASFMQ
ncbi:MAG: nitroreductase family protein [Desulfatibacillaceae bacterium]